ncbi:MAG TPA: FeoC-like transcriptional regulator [Segeticoccus sp.]|uniref:DprA-like winged helix domain-containing protein n=1 Tax=Segeticoccus sp. TaxID=2706531 RepID=UPI002D801926|nr:FeoC-like transcriptional regulator [Segeticoccus sp.]HET8601976.1 FeoC-like transcriptional regulator [Segeticoccus sp.]
MSASPSRAVLDAFAAGATSVDQVAGRTGLSADVVRTAVDQLVRLGRMDAKELTVGCPDGGCGSCASGTADGGAGCGASGPSMRRSGPVLVSLAVRPPR